MLNVVQDDLKKEMTKKKAIWIISRYLKFITPLKKHILKDMVELGLIENKNRYTIKIINPEKSANINKELLIKIVEAGSNKKYKNNLNKSAMIRLWGLI